MAIKHIVFDLGGVIVRINVPGYIKNLAGQSGFSSEKIKHLLRDNCDIIDQKPNLTEQYQVGSIDTETYFKQGAQLLDHKISPTQLRVFWQQVIVGEDEDVLNFIQTLQKKYHLALFSNTNDCHWQYMKQIGFQFFSQFNKVYASHLIKKAKPDVKVFEFMQHEFNATADQCLMIDDTLPHVNAAKKAGWHGIHYQNLPQLQRALGQLNQTQPVD